MVPTDLYVSTKMDLISLKGLFQISITQKLSV